MPLVAQASGGLETEVGLTYFDLFALPYPVLMAGFIAVAVGGGCGLHLLVRRTVAYEKLVEHNDVAGFTIAVVGVLYAVLVAFVVVVVWQQYNDSDANYAGEVSAVADIVHESAFLPAGTAARVRSAAQRYIGEMIDDEWPAMRAGGASAPASATLAMLTRTVAGVVPGDGAAVASRERLDQSVQRLFDLRNRRLADNAQTLPPVLWATLLVGAAITVGFGYLFGVANFRVQLIMTGAVSALIALMFVLLVELDFPFRRDTAISAARWTDLQRQLTLAAVAGLVPAARNGAGGTGQRSEPRQ